MRILHAIHSVNPAGGGPIECVRSMSAVHRADGCVVEVVSLDDPAAPWVTQIGLPVHATGPSRPGYGYARGFCPWLRANLHRFDVVVVNGLWQYSSLGVWKVRRGSGVPYVVFPHGMLDPWFKRRYPLKHVKKCLYWWAVEYRCLRDAAMVFFTCEEERRLARESFRPYHCREAIVTLGTREPTGDPEEQRRAFREQVPAIQSRRYLLFLGRLHEKKGLDLLIPVYGALTSAWNPAWGAVPALVIAGPANDADYARRLRTLAQKTVREPGLVVWVDMVQGESKWGALRGADAFLLPSHQENFGVAVAEALACGVPVLISNRVNIWREVVGDHGGLADDDDTAGTERLLRQWLAMPAADHASMHHAARRCFQNRFRIETTAATFLGKAREILGEASARASRAPLER